MKVVGVDGCSGGWVSVCLQDDSETIEPVIHESFAELLDYYSDADAIGVDIPIGLSQTGPRACDLAARKLLGRGRSSSVFPAPHPDVLKATSYTEAVELSRLATQKGLSQQTYAILDKVAEVNATLTPDLQDRVFEVHPEVSFWALAGRPMVNPKGHLAGHMERKAVLEESLNLTIPERAEAFRLARPAKPDDILDAVVAAGTARRVVEGAAGRLPEMPEIDYRGLRMEIVY